MVENLPVSAKAAKKPMMALVFEVLTCRSTFLARSLRDFKANILNVSEAKAPRSLQLGTGFSKHSRSTGRSVLGRGYEARFHGINPVVTIDGCMWRLT
jgi:hypothetical protein